MASDPEILVHKSWLGLLQPVGLVVSPPALVKAQAVLSRNVAPLQQTLLSVVRRPPKVAGAPEADAYLDDFPRFAHEVLGWQVGDLAGAAGGPALPTDLEVVLPDYGETLRPSYAVVDPDRSGKWLLQIQLLPWGTELDAAGEAEGRTGWDASPQAKFERLLREKQVPAGLLGNATHLRLVYAPHGETSGHLTFPIQALCEVAGRPLLAGLQLLLDEFRLFSAPAGRRLPDLLKESRRYQNEVSTKLAEQVLDALWELLRGFQAADESSGGRLLTEVASEDPQHIYGGLITTLLRLVFLLYAEDQGLMPKDPVYQRHYSVGGLYERLREDAGRYPDTMDQRYGAWAWLLSLFRLVFDGGGRSPALPGGSGMGASLHGSHEELHLPARHGRLFDPDAYPFLEGRPLGSVRVMGERLEPPRVSDGCIHRALQGLLILDGERLSYRSLDVEQIGSVYEAIMGFAVERAPGPAIGVRPHHVVVDVRELLAEKPTARAAQLKAEASCDLTGKALEDLKTATTPEAVVAALGRKVSPRTPRLLLPGALYLQPGEERRRSGSHYRWKKGEAERLELEAEVEALRAGEDGRPGVTPLHWEIEFPEVFGRENPGFDCVVGNPPFAGKNNVINGNATGYLEWLKELHEGAHGNADLVAHFFRRTFAALRERGAFGLIATNTIAQGDTRNSGLTWICTHGGTIYEATRRYKWPGAAAVVVSIVHVRRGASKPAARLDGKTVPQITAFLFHGGGHENPAVLQANGNKSFIGSYVLGMGFTFDDTDTKGVASPLAEMRRLIAQDPRNAERIFPYIGGEEINSTPTHAHHRYVLNFGDMSEADARRWPDLMGIIEARVRPERLAQNREIRARYWWRFGETTPALFSAIRGLARVLANSQVSSHVAFAFLPPTWVYAHTLNVFPLPTHAAFCALQSRVHEVWARFFASSMKDDLRYTPTDCFETFPFPPNWQSDPTLEAAGQAYYDFRAALMIRNNEGLTKTYNRFHDPDERGPDILRLRELHASMDRAVLDAYGWTDISTACEFRLDYEIDEETWGSKKKPYRYRWPEEVHDEVLARLLELNRQRAEEERLAGLAAEAKEQAAAGQAGRKGRGRGRRHSSDDSTLPLLPEDP